MMIRGFLLLLFVGFAASQSVNTMLTNLVKKPWVEKAAFADTDGKILAKSKDYALRQGEATTLAKGADNWGQLGGTKINHEGLPFTVSEAMDNDYIIASRGKGQRTLTVHKTDETYIVFILCAKNIKEADCVTKSVTYAKYLKDMGH